MSYEADPKSFATPAVELVFALSVSKLSGPELAVMLAAIGHCFGPPRWELKGTLLRLSRHWLGGTLGWSRSTVYEAIEGLLRRGMLRSAANKCLIVNKRLHEWRDGQGAPLFAPRADATANMVKHLARWPWFGELAQKVPLAAGMFDALSAPKLDASSPAAGVENDPQTAAELMQNGPPTPPEFLTNRTESHVRHGGRTSAMADAEEGKTSAMADCQNGKTSAMADANVRHGGLVGAANAAEIASRAAKDIEMVGRFNQPDAPRLDLHTLCDYAATAAAWRPRLRAQLLAMLQTCVAQNLDASRITRAVEELVNNSVAAPLQNPLGYLRSRIQNPALCVEVVRVSFATWCERERRSPVAAVDASTVQRASHAERVKELNARARSDGRELLELAHAYSRRPRTQQAAACDELRRGGGNGPLLARRLEQWRDSGAGWSSLAAEKHRPLWLAMAEGERALRGPLAEVFGASPSPAANKS